MSCPADVSQLSKHQEVIRSKGHKCEPEVLDSETGDRTEFLKLWSKDSSTYDMKCGPSDVSYPLFTIFS